MADFHFHIAPETLLGPDSILKLPVMAARIADRVMLVADPALHDGSTIARVQDILEARGVKVLLFDDVPENATSDSIGTAVSLARGAKSPLVVGLGGQRTLWAAKAIAALAQGGEIDDWLDGQAPRTPAAGLILVPTAVRDPFVLEERFVVTDARNRNAVLLASTKSADVVIFDPNLQASLSPMKFQISILDALMSCVEGSISSKADFFSDAILERAVRSLVQAFDLSIRRPDDPNARLEACRGGFLAAVGVATSSLTVGSAVSFAINSRFKIPKANIAAVLLPYLLEMALKFRLERVAAFAPAFGVHEDEGRTLPVSEAATRVVEAVRTRLGMLKIPSRLKDFEIDLDRLVETAEIARSLEISGMMPRVVSVDDIFDLIKTAY